MDSTLEKKRIKTSIGFSVLYSMFTWCRILVSRLLDVFDQDPTQSGLLERFDPMRSVFSGHRCGNVLVPLKVDSCSNWKFWTQRFCQSNWPYQTNVVYLSLQWFSTLLRLRHILIPNFFSRHTKYILAYKNKIDRQKK